MMTLMENITAVWEQTTARRAYVQLGGKTLKFEASNARFFKKELEAFCANHGATEMKEVRT
jgi:hypothetical protein